jgi:ATP-binding cassette, subfamily B, multidrug efflux pump
MCYNNLCLKGGFSLDVFRKIWLFTGKYKSFLFSGVAFVILTIIVSMIPGYINRRIIDDVITAGDIELLPKLLIILLVVTAFRSIFILLERYYIETLSQNTLRDLKQAVYDHLEKMSFNFYNNNRTGELMSRMTGDMEALRQIIAEGLIQLTHIIFYFLFTIIILFTLNVQLTLISLAASPFIAFFAYRLSKTIRPAFSNLREQFSQLNTTVQENISGIRIVKAFDQQEFEIDKFDKDNNKYFLKNYNVVKIWARYFPVLEFLGGVSTFFLLFFGGRLVIQGDITLGIWIQFNSYLWMLIIPMRLLGNLVNMINVTIASGERIFKLLEEKPDITNPEKPVKIDKFKGEVEFKNISLYYDKKKVLQNINLHIKPAQTIAIMGATGTGKTSLINLIGRYYDPTNGQIYIDGINLKEMDLKKIRSQVAVVIQENFLFSETIYKNIAYGKPDTPMEEVKEAARIAGASEFIEEMNEGYQTVVGERGMGLSGGQKQRVCLARAILQKAPILILDDATSAVDMETEHVIQQSLSKIKDKATIFIVAHRISSVRHADKIIILKNGQIAESGNHQELIQQKGEYYTIFKEQYRGLLKEDYYRRKQVT